jgi:hypothetical protein
MQRVGCGIAIDVFNLGGDWTAEVVIIKWGITADRMNYHWIWGGVGWEVYCG